MLKIKNIELKTDAIMAPLAGYTDVGFRSLVSLYGAAYTITEMISAKGLCYDSEKTKELLYTSENEKIKAVQIFGSEPDFIYKCIKSKYLDKFDIIDINMGCPVPKIVKNGEGSALLKSPDIAFEIVQAAVKASDGRPITVKMRRGYNLNEDNSLEFAKMLEEAGASMIAIHGRYKDQMYSGKSDRECIKKIKKHLNIPIIANGDVFTKEDYFKIKEETNADGVLIARGALGNPSIFLDIQNKKKIMTKKEEIFYYIKILQGFFKDEQIYKFIKSQICFYLKGTKNARKKVNIINAKSLNDIICELNTINF